MKLSVVIPTTHRIAPVLELARHIATTCPVPVTITVVDNGPHATDDGWGGLEGEVVVRPYYLGSEQAFILGLRCAPSSTRYLLLDHDAGLYDNTLSKLLDAAGDDEAVYSGNQNGDGSSWDRSNGRAPAAWDLTQETVIVDFAPWSGLLLNARGREIVISQDSGFFFFWDDYLACWALKRAGIQIWGVPAAVIENVSDPKEKRSPWRAYYCARNHILFHRRTGCGSRVELVLVRGKEIYTALPYDNRIAQILAIVRGSVDGIRNFSGTKMTP